MKPKLTQEQRLSWKLTQQLGQAIEILQYNGYQLNQFLENQMKENPLIEVETEKDVPFEPTLEGHLSFDEKIFSPESEDLASYVRGQLIDKHMTPKMKEAVEFGIDSLDENGYLTVTLSEWQDNVGTDEQTVAEALQLIQSLDPAGIGARRLQECLYLQLKRNPEPNEVTMNLVREHLEWIADYRLDEIMAEYDISESEAIQAIKEVQSLDPKPGTSVAGATSSYIVPDAEVFQEQGMWRISLTKWNRPTVTVHDHYLEVKQIDKKEENFIKKYVQQGKWLQKALQQRYESLEKIFGIIVKRQLAFFDRGPETLKPMVLKDIAADVNLHSSTVSRAVKEKYLQTPHGVFPVKFFFQSGVSTQTGAVSAYTTKTLIRELIEHEDKAKPLSDQQICEKLQREYHMGISRRTVTKYRLALHLPSSTKRKRRPRP
ncbi:RNA polymerase factor sigma-54 [Salinibacillus xinjiangensis]|uniref:RNA polymerase factor sigma-54 n=1 Tax=Salinibacillus xinjiangensis TaxID=1229268 RepID=A0A6G1X1G3_9BACI|nr:RNA polymerase factor sigma-54 [Salinibacillus xinjiangensis]MRG84726.1 RNA polymerase factor sigma-54 [Salinibacillus xinjiangensis]